MSDTNAPERFKHPYSGIALPQEVFADPGRRGWYFRAKMPDSVARYVRADLLTAAQARIAALETAEAEMRERCAVVAGNAVFAMPEWPADFEDVADKVQRWVRALPLSGEVR